MSNALAIATVTSALAQVVRTAVQSAVAGSDVVTTRPDATAPSGAQARLFLYQVLPNAALRNSDLQTRAANGTLMKRPVAAIDLHYLLAFYGNESNLEPQRMLAATVRDLHARPVLLRQMIRDAITAASFLTGSDLEESVEQIKFAPFALSLEELSKLWSVFFQAPYALSVAYQASVVLLESDENALAALPVLRRGEDDRGVATVLGPFPVLRTIHIGAIEDAAQRPRRPSHPSAQLGAHLTIDGDHLSGDVVRVRFAHARLPVTKTIEIPPADRTASELRVLIGNDGPAQTDWAAGLYTVSATVERGTETKTTNDIPLSFAPRIQTIAPANPVPITGGDATLTITCGPQVRRVQRAALLLGDRDVQAESHTTDTATLTFVIKGATPVTDAVARLRIDGVDSLPFKRVTVPAPPHFEFDDAQKVTIT